MNMREKEDLVIKILESMGKAKYATIKSSMTIYGCEKFGPATLTSMVNRGLLIKEGLDYSLSKIQKSPEERELEGKVREFEGILNHLTNSRNKWPNVIEELGLGKEFGDSYISWNEALYAEVNKMYEDYKARLDKVEGAF